MAAAPSRMFLKVHRSSTSLLIEGQPEGIPEGIQCLSHPELHWSTCPLGSLWGLLLTLRGAWKAVLGR